TRSRPPNRTLHGETTNLPSNATVELGRLEEEAGSRNRHRRVSGVTAIRAEASPASAGSVKKRAPSGFFLHCVRFYGHSGVARHFLASGGAPHLRAQAVAKGFGWDAPPRSASHVEDAAAHRGGVAIDGS